MINFASLFNQFRVSSASELIDTPGVTLERLLEEDSFLNEFKSGSTKVQQLYLCLTQHELREVPNPHQVHHRGGAAL
jgi:hypothetical protein